MPDSYVASMGSAFQRPHNHQPRTAMVTASWRGSRALTANRYIGFAEADDCPDDTAAPTVDRPQTQTKPRNRFVSRASCGTESSTPFPSSGESANHRFRGETKGAGGLDFSAIYCLIDKPERKI